MSGDRVLGGRIPDEFINDLLARVDIVDLIDAQVPLKKTGANYVARCPFHTEKTPSFSVNRNKQFYHCFGCGVSGNAIGFLMAFNHLNFVEAIEDLATYAGVSLPKDTTELSVTGKLETNRLYDLMAQVADYYAEQLLIGVSGKKAVAYLKKRGISRQIVTEFKLGYALADWQGVANCFNRSALLEAGMLISKEEGQVYDRFRDRIMFPIRDKRGRVIGFGGRVLDDSLPKYLNSPETALFHKGQEVYGLYELLQKNTRPQRILLVEGYMDVIALVQSGFDTVVAALGTSVSQAHGHLLFRFTAELVLCFDGDRAGNEAAWRAMEAIFPCLKEGRQVRIMVLPTGHDPDSLVRSEGLQAFSQRVDDAQALSDYFFNTLLTAQVKLSEVEGRASLANRAKPYLEKLPEGIFKDLMLAKLSELTNAPLKVGGELVSKSKYKSRLTPPLSKNSRPPLQRYALALLIQNPMLIEQLENQDSIWLDFEFKGADKFKEILQVILEKKPTTTAVILEYFRNTPDEPIIRQLASLVFELQEGLEAEFNGALQQLVVYDRRLKFDRLLSKFSAGQLEATEQELFQQLSMLKSKNFNLN